MIPKSSKTKKVQGTAVGAPLASPREAPRDVETPLGSLPGALRDAAAEDSDGPGDVSDQQSEADHKDPPSSATSAQGSSGSFHDFIASLGLPASPVIPGLVALAAMVNAHTRTHFTDSVLVARQILGSGRDLTQGPPGIFEKLRLSEFRDDFFRSPEMIFFSSLLSEHAGWVDVAADAKNAFNYFCRSQM